MDAMHLALEDDLSIVHVSLRECRIRAAYEWIKSASEPLDWADENKISTVVPSADFYNYRHGGSRYHGWKTMCAERWEFWRGTFEELAKKESGLSVGEQVRQAAPEAVRAMVWTEGNGGLNDGARSSHYNYN